MLRVRPRCQCMRKHKGSVSSCDCVRTLAEPVCSQGCSRPMPWSGNAIETHQRVQGRLRCCLGVPATFCTCRGSSVGRASDRRSEGPQLDPGSWHLARARMCDCVPTISPRRLFGLTKRSFLAPALACLRAFAIAVCLGRSDICWIGEVRNNTTAEMTAVGFEPTPLRTGA